MNIRALAMGFVGAAALAVAWGCDGRQAPAVGSGSVKIDGSSTVFPITEAVAEEFAVEWPRLRVTIGVSGTGGGFKRFTTGETDISNASRPINGAEAESARANGVEFIELPVAFDGLSIVVNPGNSFVDALTLEEVRKIFLEGGAKRWNEVRAEWPDELIRVYSPGTDSGTFDYFREVVAGKTGAIRADMSVSEDDNVLVRGVAGDVHAIGFFGYAYYFENKGKLRLTPIDAGAGPVAPSEETIESGAYAPFSRPLFIYVSKAGAERPEVKAFVDFYLANVGELAAEVGYVRLPSELAERVRTRWERMQTGSAFLNASGAAAPGALSDVYDREAAAAE